MDKDTVHEPELPGVHTFKDDIEDTAPKKSFGGILFTTPEATLETVRAQSATATPRNQIGGKEVFDVERAFNNETVQEGTIVTDRRRIRRSIGGMLKSAFAEWWDNTQKSVEAATDKMEFLKPKEIPTVAAPEERVSTILQAAEHARQAPRDDHKVVIEKIRTFSHDAEVVTGKPFVIKNEVHDDAPKWQKEAQAKKVALEEEKAESVATHTLPTLDLRTSSVAPQVTKRSNTPLASYATNAEPKKGIVPNEAFTVRVPEKFAPIQPSSPKKDSTWTFFNEAPDAKIDTPPLRELKPEVTEQKSIPTPSLGSYNTVTPSVEKEEDVALRRTPHVVTESPPLQKPAPTPIVSRTPVTFEYESSSKKESDMSYIKSAPLHAAYREPKQHNKTFISKGVVIGGIVVIGSAFGIFAAFFFESPFKASEIPTPTPIAIPAFLDTDAQIGIPLQNTRNSLVNELVTRGKTSGSGVTQYYPVLDDGNTIAPTDAIMEVLEPRTSGAFIRALSQYSMFGFVQVGNTHEPFIILQSQNFDVVFAGMLEWERALSADLAPLFGTSVFETSVPNSGGATSSPRFVDALRSNRSIRILYEGGQERIVYAFVNNNLILITTNTETLAALISRIR